MSIYIFAIYLLENNLIRTEDRDAVLTRCNSLGCLNSLVCLRQRCLSWTGQAWMYDGWKKLLSVSSGDSFLSDLSDDSSVPLCSKIGAVGMYVTPCTLYFIRRCFFRGWDDRWTKNKNRSRNVYEKDRDREKGREREIVSSQVPCRQAKGTKRVLLPSVSSLKLSTLKLFISCPHGPLKYVAHSGMCCGLHAVLQSLINLWTGPLLGNPVCPVRLAA